MSVLPRGYEWIRTNPETGRIYNNIADYYWREQFVRRVLSDGKEYSTQRDLLDYYATIDPENPETYVQGYHKPTTAASEAPSSRSHPSGYNLRSGGNYGGSQAGARQDTMSAQRAGLGSNESPRYTGQPHQPAGNSASGYNYTSTGPSYPPSRQMRNDTFGNRNRDDNDPYHGDDEGYSTDSNPPPPNPYSTGSTSQRGTPYSSNQQANSGSRRSRR